MAVNKNTCPAFFEAATIGPTGMYSPCTAMGGGAFDFTGQSMKEIWENPALEEARNKSKAGEKLGMCKRCWSEEEFGHTSERQYHLQTVAEDLDYTDSAYYRKGPKNLNLKVSNVCNLRCRTCQGIDSVLYNKEGNYYSEKHNLAWSPYAGDGVNHYFSDKQIDELVEYSGNLKLIELYGGEPFLDKQIPKYLQRLIELGLNKNISLKVSTNATHKLTDEWRKILPSFNNTILNVSIDGIGERFTYMRHPGKWAVAEKNIAEFLTLENVNVVPVTVVSALNLWYVNEVFEYFNEKVEPFIILAQWPNQYCVNVIPESIKPIVEEHVNQFNNAKFDPVIELLHTAPSNLDPSRGITPWEEFKFWTKAKDEYRKEDFLTTFKEFGDILIQYDEW